MKKNIRKAGAALAAVGILITGIGAGIGFIEFASLDYAGKRVIGKTDMKVKEGEVKFTTSEESPIYLEDYYDSNEVVWDETVPENTVRYKIEYNAARADVSMQVDSNSIYVMQYYKEEDEMKTFLEARDAILEDLKNGKIGAYESKDVEKTWFYINPKYKDKIVF